MPDSLEEVGRRVGRNALHVFGGEVAVKLLAATYQVLLARYLGTLLFGELSFAMALTAILGVAADFGLGTLVTREVARRHGAVGDLLVRALWGRGVLTLLLGGAGIVLTVVTGRPREVMELVAILALTQLVQGGAELAAAAHRGLQRMLLPAVVGVVCRLGLVLTGFVAMALDARVHAFAALTVLWTIPAAAALIRALPDRPRLTPPPARDILAALRRALPIGIGAVLWTFYFRLDLLLLGWLRGDTEVGLFAAPFRLVKAALLVQSPLLAAVFPVLARRDPGEDVFRAAVKQTVRVLALLGAPIAAVLVVESRPVVTVLFGVSFAPASHALALLALAVPVSFAAAPFLQVLLSRDREKTYALLMGSGALAAPVLGLTLIPRWGVTGAAGAMLATEAVVAVLAVIAGSRVAGARAALSVLARAGLAGAGLAGALLAARSLGLGAPVRIGLGILVVYPILTLALRAFRTQDLRLLLTALGARRKG